MGVLPYSDTGSASGGWAGVAGVSELILDPQAELQELAAIEAESIGWHPLGDGAYLHVGDPDEEETVITVVGVPQDGEAVLLVG